MKNLEKNPGDNLEIPFPLDKKLSLKEIQEKFNKEGLGALTPEEKLRLRQHHMAEDRQDRDKTYRS